MSAATAAGIAAAVRAGAPPVDAVRVALDRIAVLDGELGAFATVRREAALTEVATWQAAALEFMIGRDLLLTPTTATAPPPAVQWSRRSWRSNVLASLRYSGGFTGAGNLAGWPAVSVPAGIDPATATPIGVQLVGRPGDEELLIAVAALVERLRPWPRVFGAR